MITIKEYADSRKKTPQSVYRMIDNHKSELKGCIKVKNGVKNITPKGVKLLDEFSQERIKVVEVNNIVSEDFEEELNTLREKVISLQDKVQGLQDEVIRLQKKETGYLTQINQLLIEQQKPKGLKAVWNGLFNKNTGNSQKVDTEGQ